MKVFKESYITLKEKIKAALPEARTIDIWNEQIDMYREESPLILPAIYIQFTPVQWRTIGRGKEQHGDGSVIFHIVQNVITNSATLDGGDAPVILDTLARFDLPQKAYEKMQYFRSNSFKPLDRIGSDVDHNHDGIIIDSIEFATIFMDSLSVNANDQYSTEIPLPDIKVEPNEVPAHIPENGTFSIDL